MIPAKMAASGFPRESAITANVRPAIAATPAASPSIPSRKLTMFMIATIHRIVSGAPAHSGSAWMPSSGNVKRSTQIPNHTGIDAASNCPTSFSYQRSPRKSSIAPIVTATAAPSSRPRVSCENGRNASPGTKMPRKSATPPSRGTGLRFSRRPPGASTTPSTRALPPTAGVRRTTTANATSAPQTTCRWSVRTESTEWCEPPASCRSTAAIMRSPYPVLLRSPTSACQAALIGEDDGVDAIAEAELAEHRRHVRFDGGRLDHERSRDLCVRHPAREEQKNVAFTGGQLVECGNDRRRPRGLLDQPPRARGGEGRIAVVRRTDGGDELLRRRGLEQEAGSTRAECLDDVLVQVERREHEDPRRRERGEEPSGRFAAVALGHADVHQDEVGPRFARALDGFLTVC